MRRGNGRGRSMISARRQDPGGARPGEALFFVDMGRERALERAGSRRWASASALMNGRWCLLSSSLGASRSSAAPEPDAARALLLPSSKPPPLSQANRCRAMRHKFERTEGFWRLFFGAGSGPRDSASPNFASAWSASLFVVRATPKSLYICSLSRTRNDV